MSYCTVSSNVYVKRGDFDIVNFPFLDCDVPRRTSYGAIHCISQLIRSAKASSHVCDYGSRHEASDSLNKLDETSATRYISEPEFYGYLVYKFRQIVGKSDFSEQFIKLINR